MQKENKITKFTKFDQEKASERLEFWRLTS